MEFRLLGPVEAWHNGVPVDLGDLQQRYVLVVLLLHRNRPVPSEVVTDMIWGDRRPTSNLTSGYIGKIRRAFRAVGAEDVALDTTPTGYVLRIAPEQVDVDRFHRLCDKAAQWPADPHRATPLLREAVELWRGRFLEDLDIDRVGGSAVARPDEAYLDALGDLAELELAAGRHRWVRDHLRPVVQSEPERPRLVALLMRALLANGDPAQAIEIYHRTRHVLDEELGIPVPVELRVLAGVAQYPAPRSTLPARTPRFIGRNTALATIITALRAATDMPRVAWISGEPGIGKTALAIQAAYELADHFPDGRLYLSATDTTIGIDPAAALAQLLRDLGVPAASIPVHLADRAAIYQSLLADTRTLLVIDDAADRADVDLLIPRAPGCAAIITSRDDGTNGGGFAPTAFVPIGPLTTAEATTLFRSLVDLSRLHGQDELVDHLVQGCGRRPLLVHAVAHEFRQRADWSLAQLLALLGETPHPAAAPANKAARRQSDPALVPAIVPRPAEHLHPDDWETLKRVAAASTVIVILVGVAAAVQQATGRELGPNQGRAPG